ncbi:MAG: GNAT family N-acetyltransferase [Saprospiraceae bacterium]
MSQHMERYRAEHEKWPQLPVFFRPWYLDVTCGYSSWDISISVDKGGRVQGVLPYFKSSKYGIAHITMPLLTPYLGPWYIYPINPLKQVSKLSFEKKVLEDLLSQIPNVSMCKMHCHPDVQNVLSANWQGYDCLVRYTYVLHKNKEAVLWEGLDSKQRNIITSAKECFYIERSEEISSFLVLNQKSFERTGMNTPYSELFFTNLFDALKLNNACDLYIAKDKEGIYHAGILIVKDLKNSYCLAIGNDPRYKNSGGLPLLMWHVILESFKSTKSFNFEGGMITNIEKYFRSYGGELTPYYRLQKARNNLLKGIFTWIKKI